MGLQTTHIQSSAETRIKTGSRNDPPGEQRNGLGSLRGPPLRGPSVSSASSIMTGADCRDWVQRPLGALLGLEKKTTIKRSGPVEHAALVGSIVAVADG